MTIDRVPERPDVLTAEGRLRLVGRASAIGLTVLLIAYITAYFVEAAYQLLILAGASALCILVFWASALLAEKSRVTLGTFLSMLAVSLLLFCFDLLLPGSIAAATVGVLYGVSIGVYVLGSEKAALLVIVGLALALINLLLAWQPPIPWFDSLPRAELSSGLALVLNAIMLLILTGLSTLLIIFGVREYQVAWLQAQQYSAELGVAQDALEKQVLDRTEELAGANERLLNADFQLQQAQQETQQALAQLEQANEEKQRALIQLQQTNDALGSVMRRSQWRVAQFEAIVQISHTITSILELDALLHKAVDLIVYHFKPGGVQHVAIFMPDEVGRNVVAQAGSGRSGRHMVEMRHHFEIGEQSVVGAAAFTRQPQVASGQEAVQLAEQFPFPDMRDTRFQVAIPLVFENNLIGVLDIHSKLERHERDFESEQVTVLQSVANQLAIAIINAQHLAESEARLEAIEEAQRHYVGHVWEEYLATKPVLGFEYDLRDILPAKDELPVQALKAAETGQAVVQDRVQVSSNEDQPAALTVPIKVRGAVIGALGLQREGADAETIRSWTHEEIALMETIAEEMGIALETARLLEETQLRALREQFTRQITDKIRSAGDVDGILQTTIRELSRTLQVPRVSVQLAAPVQDETPANLVKPSETQPSVGEM